MTREQTVVKAATQGVCGAVHALGKTDEGRTLHITFTLRQSSQLIRVISARDMHRKERAIYEQAD